MKKIYDMLIDAMDEKYNNKHQRYFKNKGTKEKDFVSVEGGEYRPEFAKEEIDICDMFVSKYQVTQEIYEKITGNNPSNFKGNKLPVERITWIEAMKFCNGLSEREGLQPTYKIEDDKLLKIIYKNGEEADTNKADFSRTEGYRLPTGVEWEWFARGGKIAIQNKTFDTAYSGSNNISKVAWYKVNSNNKTHNVGDKRANQLGLFQCTGNVWEWCYDRYSDTKKISNKQKYRYDKGSNRCIIRGGSYIVDVDNGKITNICLVANFDKYSDVGFRVVRSFVNK